MKTYNMKHKLVGDDAGTKPSASYWKELSKEFGRNKISR